MPVVMCVTNSHVSEFIQLEAGKLYWADSQIVRENPSCFDPDIEKYAIGYVAPPVIEQATVNPGEIRRGPGRPRKDV